MSLQKSSFLSSSQLSNSEVDQLFDRTRLFKEEFEKKGTLNHLIKTSDPVVALVFAEPSTRTRLSFQMACYRLGLKTITLDNPSVASLSKGETLSDTLRNVAAMMPDAMVTRFNEDSEAEATIANLGCPIINGGVGTKEHPTQALSDAYTILEHRGQVSGEKVLIVGDVLHSRVANSNLILLQKMGAEIAYCAPEEFIPQQELWKGVKSFSTLEEGVRWATVIMGLRVQRERHSQRGLGLSIAEYRERYRVGGDQLEIFDPKGILLHPGPVIRGVEFSDYVLNEPRCKVLDQVSAGVFVRAALVSFVLGLEVQKA
ncbi:aspartate carbamoyltransferase catalytic subunit [bacterium]|nr:aspartate carbamoyltransferase catalytic subunit [bacterium]